ncbi:hypothetical protein AB0F72_08705 [Actinoplanes sp. NPDC023936]|uniref:hypothetical protein n=1 Tax=Actinoplanes sp. NPDC023936 TaxID=3154910 RepID=UPI003400C556
MIALNSQDFQTLADGGYVQFEHTDGRTWRLAHDDYSGPFQEPADRHWALEAAEVELIGRDPAGLTVGGTVIRRAAT